MVERRTPLAHIEGIVCPSHCEYSWNDVLGVIAVRLVSSLEFCFVFETFSLQGCASANLSDTTTVNGDVKYFATL